MKKVISISLGSDKRDHKVKTKFLGEHFSIERRGTNGDKKKAAHLFSELDGNYDAFGLGGIDLSIKVEDNKYYFRDAKKLIKGVKKTPVVDGSGLKNTLERIAVNYLVDTLNIDIRQKKVLVTSAMDRFGMAEAFNLHNSDLIYGDLIFGLGIPIRIKSLKALKVLASIVAPVVTKLPFELVYPTGSKQDNFKESDDKYKKYYDEADIIAGDFHYIKSHLPKRINNKIILTNTTTKKDIKDLKKRGAKSIITTTPNLNGRTFGTNVMEALLITIIDKDPKNIRIEDYLDLLNKLDFKPNHVPLNEERVNINE
ncbi:MAG: quinate 5-dehydrogenase [Halanaerobiales bacterium]|nr:quinate 5-dehydrogenase [Halanaerobiales bacterium]